MTTKKDPGRFTVRFNLSDPAHRDAVAFLERQGARNKATYLANAILCYENAAPQSAGKVLQGPSRADIEAIVWEVLAKWQPETLPDLEGAPGTTRGITPSENKQKHSSQDDALGLISDALAAFQAQ